ncbi:MAG TPA: C-type lectin domain-containing protein [Kofleriaceae bacterium]|nr:C-type lectin domain-containing protein [Kofleriaceae bacterium]
MRWAVCAALVSTACGRLAFDDLSGTRDATDGVASDAVQGDASGDAVLAACAGIQCTGAPKQMMCDGRCITLCPDSVSQDTADTRCIAWGGQLATVHDATDDACVSQLTNPPAWIGYMQQAGATTVAGNWSWLDGVASPYVNWGTGEPQDGQGTEDGEEQCAVMFADGLWYDTSCSAATFPFVCTR